MPNKFFYSNVASPTTLAGSISAGATTINVAATQGFPTSFPYVLAVDFGAGTEELVSVAAASSDTLTVVRGFSGTSAQSHSLGAVVRHVYHAGDATDFRTHEAATQNVHGVTGDLVGATSTQTLTNKTLTEPIVDDPTMTNGGQLGGVFGGDPGFSGNPTFTGEPTFADALFVGPTAADTPASFQVQGDGAFRLTVGADGKMQWGSGAQDPDVSMERVDDGVLQVDGTFQATTDVASTRALAVEITGDADARWDIQGDGTMFWGDGTAVPDTNLYRPSPGTLTTDTDLEVGGGLTVHGVGAVLTAHKGADTARSQNATLADDPDLTLSLDANATYLVEWCIFYTANSTTGRINFAQRVPSGSTGSIAAWSPDGAMGTGFSTAEVRLIGTASPTSAQFAGGAGTGVIVSSRQAGTLVTGSTAGTYAVQWAQAESSTTATTVKQFSWIKLTRVA
jgi:hypothetical protein